MRIEGLHHVAIIASDYARSKHFYTEVLGLRVVAEHYRAERDSWKLDLALPDGTQVECVRSGDRIRLPATILPARATVAVDVAVVEDGPPFPVRGVVQRTLVLEPV